MADGFVPGGIGLHLGAVQSNIAEAHHAGLLAQAQNLQEQITQRVEVAAALTHCRRQSSAKQ
jgi:hypothetical protein